MEQLHGGRHAVHVGLTAKGLQAGQHDRPNGVLGPRRDFLLVLHTGDQTLDAGLHHLLGQCRVDAAKGAFQFLDHLSQFVSGDALGVAAHLRAQQKGRRQVLLDDRQLGRHELHPVHIVELEQRDVFRVGHHHVAVSGVLQATQQVHPASRVGPDCLDVARRHRRAFPRGLGEPIERPEVRDVFLDLAASVVLA